MTTPEGQPRGERAHTCRGCGYDLGGLDGSTCPECGMAFVKGKETESLRQALRGTRGGRCAVCGATVPAGSAKCPTCGCRVVRPTGGV